MYMSAPICNLCTWSIGEDIDDNDNDITNEFEQNGTSLVHAPHASYYWMISNNIELC